MATTINTNTTLTKDTIAAQKPASESAYKALLKGIETELKDVTSFLINQIVFTKQSLMERFQARIDAAEKTNADRTALHTSVAAERTLQLEVMPLRKGLKRFLESRYGNSSAELQKFGLTPAKVPQRRAATKPTGVTKAKATRVARGTKGKKQKANIKGTAPVTSASAPAQATANPPAPAAPPAAKPGPPPTTGGTTREARAS